ncbi:OmpA family protein [Plantactinospora sonchi]|uniref:OmpA family protein n=1 Tax=Plantactinospora sonchi TaxID=1544735 RepID=A0ABU7RLT5_9ACTN
MARPAPTRIAVLVGAVLAIEVAVTCLAPTPAHAEPTGPASTGPGGLVLARAEPTGPASPARVVPGPELPAGAQVVAPVVDLAVPAVGLAAPTRDIYVQSGDLDGNNREAETDQRVELTLNADVLFRFGSDALSQAARERLTTIAERLRTQARGTVRIDGHTDAIGDDASNRELSRRRAEAVRDVLREALAGTALDFEVHGHGESRPVAPNVRDGRDNPAGRARNRRVEIRFDR